MTEGSVAVVAQDNLKIENDEVCFRCFEGEADLQVVMAMMIE